MRRVFLARANLKAGEKRTAWGPVKVTAMHANAQNGYEDDSIMPDLGCRTKSFSVIRGRYWDENKEFMDTTLETGLWETGIDSRPETVTINTWVDIVTKYANEIEQKFDKRYLKRSHTGRARTCRQYCLKRPENKNMIERAAGRLKKTKL